MLSLGDRSANEAREACNVAEPRMAHVSDLPVNTEYRIVRPRRRDVVVAELSSASAPGDDTVPYEIGEHYVVEAQTGLPSIVPRAIFERMYHEVKPHLYRLRRGLRLRATIADRPLCMKTLEGEKSVARGDWIMVGVADELWPITANEARTGFTPVTAVSGGSVGVTVLLVFLMLAFAALMATWNA